MPTLIMNEDTTEPQTEVSDAGNPPDEPTETLNEDEELWPGGPTIKQIDAWKEQYGDGNVYVTSLTPEKHVVWRVINRHEYTKLVSETEAAINSGVSRTKANLQNEEAMAALVILYPAYNKHAPSEELAGTASLISQQALEASGFNAVEVRVL